MIGRLSLATGAGILIAMCSLGGLLSAFLLPLSSNISEVEWEDNAVPTPSMVDSFYPVPSISNPIYSSATPSAVLERLEQAQLPTVVFNTYFNTSYSLPLALFGNTAPRLGGAGLVHGGGGGGYGDDGGDGGGGGGGGSGMRGHQSWQTPLFFLNRDVELALDYIQDGPTNKQTDKVSSLSNIYCFALPG